MKTQVGIIGAGPAGLFLSHLLNQHGIESVILEARSRAYAEGRVRAGVLEAGTINTLNNLGLGDRMNREGLVDNGLDMRFRGRTIHLDLPGLTGRSVKIYGQQEVVKDLIAARLESGDPLIFDAEVIRLEGLDSDAPRIHYRHEGIEKTLDCLFVAGCDGFHGIARAAVPEGLIQTYTREYDFAWLGVLAHAAPMADMTYTNHDRGFALCSRRSMSISRLYLQVPLSDTQEDWSDSRFWDELHTRMFDGNGQEIQEGKIFQRDIARLRSYIAQPMQYGNLFLAGDAVHIVPPAGAKGLNMAVADVRVLCRSMAAFFSTGSRAGLDRYSAECEQRIWKTIRFSVHLTGLLHRFNEHTPFERGTQLAELEHIASSESAQRMIAEQYVNLSDVAD
ncbi:p-hydroxybenzoate 3-monooxygenase [Comamonas sp. BIGb0124]|uniref:4-hydroxybenzoate 3-monooxygenase n=1 Tax=Comamonas sp. BIGb0124 TaxID=2485130 RepID=UPI000F47F43B|nr:4-hydroxybenzoate 3-monooxygenase [Comamonas sp. BIGb0124]ROR23071.1 p-hydroxybenzoate 3-monooxygenase [Comamonas sp. BIGb0124]